MTKEKSLLKSRIQFLSLVAIFVVPLLLATWLFYSGAHKKWITPAASNHGELILPTRSLPEIKITNAQGDAVNLLEEARGNWVYLHVFNAECDLACSAELFKSRQVRKSLNQNIDRVERIFLNVGKDFTGGFIQDHPDAVWYLLEQPSVELNNALQQPGVNDVFLLDPIGNIVLRYRPEHTSKGMFKDIKKLLKISQIG